LAEIQSLKLNHLRVVFNGRSLWKLMTILLKAYTSHVLTLLRKIINIEESALILMAESSEQALIQLVNVMIKVDDFL